MRHLFFILCVLLACTAQLFADDRPKTSPGEIDMSAIVKIYTIHNLPDYYNPWSMEGPRGTTGSGCIISGKRILTNAHVVSDETFIQVRRYGFAKKFTARVISVSHDADLAVLTVDDADFFTDVTPLEFDGLPQPQEEVTVYGFPYGGDTLSTTRGVISRIEHRTYAHSSYYLLAAQLDAAINPGNSGGPVLHSNRIAGVVMQGFSSAENIGYMVPSPIIKHFFLDMEDGRYDGFPTLGVESQTLESPSLKRKFGLPEDQTGLLIYQIPPDSPSYNRLAPSDIITSVDGNAIADDGTIEFRPRERTSAAHQIQLKQIGETVDLTVWRSNNLQTITIPLTKSISDMMQIPADQYDVQPSYYIWGGLVFVPLTKNLLKEWGSSWHDKAPTHLVALYDDNHYEDQTETVLLLKVLPDDINQGYHNYAYWVVDRINDQPVAGLQDLVTRIEAGKSAPFTTLTNKKGEQIVLDNHDVAKKSALLLQHYRIPSDRSADLQ